MSFRYLFVAALAIILTGAGKSQPPPLSSYVGKYPFDKVNGYTFTEHPLVRRAIQAATFNASIKAAVFGKDAVTAPIQAKVSFCNRGRANRTIAECINGGWY